jgi:hypothetical protein
MSNPRGRYKCASAIAAMRAFISLRKEQFVLKSQVLESQTLEGQILKGQILERHVTLPGNCFVPGVNRMGLNQP